MYIYHELIDALSTHMMHINLNTIYTHVEHSPTDAIYLKYRKKQEKVNAMNSDHIYIYIYIGDTDLYTYTHKYNTMAVAKNLVGAEVPWEEEGFQFSF